jgi:Ni/Co efflux regulator RcnB
MKNIIHGVLAIAILAMSTAAFASEAKQQDSTTTASMSQKIVRHKASDSKTKQQKIEDQKESDFDRALLGIYG